MLFKQQKNVKRKLNERFRKTLPQTELRKDAGSKAKGELGKGKVSKRELNNNIREN